MLSTNYLNRSVVLDLLLRWLWNISKISYITPTHFIQVLLKNPHLTPLNPDGWSLEALGDLAWYRMSLAAIVNGDTGGQGGLILKAVSEVTAVESSDIKEKQKDTPTSAKLVSDAPAARIYDSPSPSIAVAAARLLEVEPEKERWRNIARDRYAAGVAEQPGTGKLHHHLGLLSKEVEGEELRGVYHFVKRYCFRIELLDSSPIYFFLV
jgi:protein SMG6